MCKEDIIPNVIRNFRLINFLAQKTTKTLGSIFSLWADKIQNRNFTHYKATLAERTK